MKPGVPQYIHPVNLGAEGKIRLSSPWPIDDLSGAFGSGSQQLAKGGFFHLLEAFVHFFLGTTTSSPVGTAEAAYWPILFFQQPRGKHEEIVASVVK